jgi:hypothetical protein
MPDNRRLFFLLVIALLILIQLPVQRIWGAENSLTELDINRLKKEISQVKTERQRLREDIARDNGEFSAYQERTAARKKNYMSETDSIRSVITAFGRKEDSLDAYITDIELKKKNFDLLKTRFREHIAKACEKLLGTIKKYPPAVSRPAVGALTFLLNDCTTKNIDNIEALQRFIQIVRNLDEATFSIQTGQEASPVPSIRGMATMLRIGSVFEAVVDEDGKNAAVWRGNEIGGADWRKLSSAEAVGAISKAIAIRESKSLPAFIFLPWGPELSKETGK